MDLVSFFAPLLGISFLIERIIEAVWNIIERDPKVSETKNSTDEAIKARYASVKQISTLIVGVVIGIVISLVLGYGFFTQLSTQVKVFSIDPLVDKVLSGMVAGATAPYSHQVLSVLQNWQKLLEEQKNKIQSEDPSQK